MAFSRLADVSAALASTRSRVQKAKLIGGLLDEAGDVIPIVVGFLTGEPRQGRIGIGYAQAFAAEVEPASEPQLTVADVDEAFSRIAAVSGPGSTGRRSDVLTGLLAKATAAEQDLIRRLLVGEVRHGALDGVVLDAVIRTGRVDEKLVRRAAMLSGDLGHVAQLAITGRTDELSTISLTVLRPLLPMLAATAPSIADAVASFPVASVEWKLDGVRIQVHRQETEVAIFTRNQNDVTSRLGEVVEVVRGFDARSFVLDGEAMSIDGSGAPSPFQETMSRIGADIRRDEVGVVPFFFDVLHLDGEDLLDTPLTDRRRILEGLVPSRFLVPSLVTDDVAAAETFGAEARALRHEGVMVKDVASTYDAGRRGSSWLKVKPVHTLDLVVLAAEWGHGRRTGRLSNLHLGARDPASGGFVMLGKTFKGLTDATLEWQTERLLELEERRTAGTVFVRPELVVEIAFDGLQASPRYPGGLSLRFARVRGYRPDKNAADADTIETVRAIHEGGS
jgi:DNA ligase 1